MRFPRKFLDAQHGESGGSFLYACDARGAGRLYAPLCRLHDGSNAGRRGAKRVFPRSGCRKCRDPPAALPPDGKFPMRPKRVCRACRNVGGGAGERAIGDRMDQMEGEGSVRLRPSAAPDAHAHAGHASRTLFANATAAIFLRSISNADILHCNISNAEYATADIT